MGLIRVTLALSVVVAHCGPLFGLRFVGGVIAVQTFFMISGFYMSLVLTTKYSHSRDFYWNRIVRLLPLYYAALVTYLAVAVALRVATGNWNGAAALWVKQPLGWVDAAAVLFAHAFVVGSDWLHFVRAGDVPLSEYLSIGVAWSLAVEFTFYLAAPLLVRLRTWALAAVAGASFALRVAIYAGADGWSSWNYFFMPSELVFFAVGMLAHRVYECHGPWLADKAIPFRFAIIGYVAFVACYMQLGLEHGQAWLPLGLFAVLLPGFFAATRESRADRLLGEWSYPIFLMHWVVLSVYAPARHFVPENWKPEAILAGTLVLSWVGVRLDRYVEARFKRRVAATLGPTRVPDVAPVMFDGDDARSDGLLSSPQAAVVHRG